MLFVSFSLHAQKANEDVIWLKNGEKYTGEIVLRNADIVMLKTADGKQFQFQVSEIEKITQQERKLANEKNKLKKFLMRYSWFRRLWRRYIEGHKELRKWPYWCEHTNEERLQNIPHVLEQFKDKEVYVTEKIDYQSVTFTGKMIPRFNNWFGRRMFNLINKLQ